MIRVDEALREAIASAVRRAEAKTDAEIVVVIAARSGSYRDVALAVGAVFAWMFLILLLWSPVNFAPTAVLVELPLAFLGACWAAQRSPALLRRLSTGARRTRQVTSSANAAFQEERVHGTRGRTGLLVYWSLLEDAVVLMPDDGLAGCVPDDAWAAVRWGGRHAPQSREALIAGLDQLGALLAGSVPATRDNPNERPDAPRVRDA